MSEATVFKNMIDRTMISVREECGPVGYGPDLHGLVFRSTDGAAFNFYHEQDCCETVDIVAIEGDLENLIGSPLLMAELVTGESSVTSCGDSQTWTFLKFATIKGYVTVTWQGQSNGYYREIPTYSERLPCEN